MLASSQLDFVIGLDIHMEVTPVGPVPFPHPFVGQIQFSPVGMLLSIGIATAMHAVSGGPQTGPVLINGFQATKTGDQASNKMVLPHIPIPPGTAWSMGVPSGDAMMISGSKTVHFEGNSACRLGSIAMGCSDPVRLPTSVLLALPKGRPVLIGGPEAIDWGAAATGILQSTGVANVLHKLIDRIKSPRLRGLLHWTACTLTGHPIDVATGRLLVIIEDFELPGPIPIKFARYYSSAWAERDSPLGYGWSHTLDEKIWVERGKVVYKAGDGREIEFHTYDLPDRYIHEWHEIFYPIDRLTLRRCDHGKWEICSPDGLVREFEFLGDYRTDASLGDRNAKIDMRVSRPGTSSTSWWRKPTATR